jgi:methyl-accepting chemotaxis protein
MSVMRRILGVLVMLAGVLGLVLSLAGMVGVWVAKPTVAEFAGTTVDTLTKSIVTSQKVMETTGQALGATVDSVDALSAMLGTTAAALEETRPVLDNVDTMMAETLPSALKAASDSLLAAEQGAQVLEGAIQSLDKFRVLLAATPLLGDLLPQSGPSYSPEKPLGASLGDLAASMQGLPDTFAEMSASLSSTGDKLMAVQGNLITMSDSVKQISSSLSQYEDMVAQSRSSMDSLTLILTSVQDNLNAILNGVAIVLTLLLAWLLAAQVVMLSQGWELFQGTADRME